MSTGKGIIITARTPCDPPKLDFLEAAIAGLLWACQSSAGCGRSSNNLLWNQLLARSFHPRHQAFITQFIQDLELNSILFRLILTSVARIQAS